MLTILHGTDTQTRAKRLAFLTEALKKKNIEVRREGDTGFDPDALRALAGSASLFGGTLGIVLSGVADTADTRDQLEKILPALAESQHHFIVSENSLNAAFIKKGKSVDATIEEFEPKVKAKKVEAFNSFLLSDALYDRKRSVAWPLYRQAIDLGLESRELHGKIFWAIKTMLIAKSSKGATDSGLNPFVFQKAKAGSANYSTDELQKMSFDLTTLFHEALVSGLDLETALEAFILRSLEKKTLLQIARTR